MPTLSEKLKSLGVKIGAEHLSKTLPPAERNPYAIEFIVPGDMYSTPLGEIYCVDNRYPPEYLHGQLGLVTEARLQVIAAWAGDARIAEFSPQDFAFIDTETTGLSGGTGTYAFLIGAGRLEGDTFHLAQFFLRDPLEEPAQLAALEHFLAPCQALVSFNGKSFDLPLLATRFITHGWRHPFSDLPHIDLLHLARRLWRDRVPSRTLGSLEVNILKTSRSQEDVPGWMIPSLYFDYLRSGDARPLQGVFYHNALDVVSLAALLNHVATLLSDPLHASLEHGVDLIALARLYEDLGDLDTATRLYLHGLEHDLPKETLLEAIQRLAAIHKTQENLPAAIDLWKKAARYQHIQAHVELAKFYEHRTRDLDEAIFWTQSAIQIVQSSNLSAWVYRQWLPDLTHRLERLQQKQARHKENS
jgi:uncharacterized protein YprB with RNaseH-like and TPR domain